MKKPNNCNIRRELRALLGYGRLTPFHGLNYVRSYEAAQPQDNSTGNHWSSTEYSASTRGTSTLAVVVAAPATSSALTWFALL